MQLRCWPSPRRCARGAEPFGVEKLLRGELQGRRSIQELRRRRSQIRASHVLAPEGTDPGRSRRRRLHAGGRASRLGDHGLQDQDATKQFPSYSCRSAVARRHACANGRRTGRQHEPGGGEKCTIGEFEGSRSRRAGVFTPPPVRRGNRNRRKQGHRLSSGPHRRRSKDYPLEGKVYNIEQPNGLLLLFGVALDFQNSLPAPQAVAHTLIEGHVEWAPKRLPRLLRNQRLPDSIPLIASRLDCSATRATPARWLHHQSRAAAPVQDLHRKHD